MKWVIIRKCEYERLKAIEEQAEWVAKGRAISRQAALNCVPDLIKAVRAKCPS